MEGGRFLLNYMIKGMDLIFSFDVTIKITTSAEIFITSRATFSDNYFYKNNIIKLLNKLIFRHSKGLKFNVQQEDIIKDVIL